MPVAVAQPDVDDVDVVVGVTVETPDLDTDAVAVVDLVFTAVPLFTLDGEAVAETVEVRDVVCEAVGGRVPTAVGEELDETLADAVAESVALAVSDVDGELVVVDDDV